MKKTICVFISVTLIAGLAVISFYKQNHYTDENKSSDSAPNDQFSKALNKSSITAGLNYIYQSKTTSEEASDSTVSPDFLKETELMISVSDDDTVTGTLTLPKSGKKFTCVVLVHDAGLQDRNETSYGNAPFRDLAWELAKRGIASYRYEKRFVPDGVNTEITIDDEIVNDAVNSVNVLKQRKDIEDVYVLGLGLGGHMIPKISELTEGASGYIIMGGFVRTIGEIAVDQYEYIAKLDGEVTAEEKSEIEILTESITYIEDPDELSTGSMLLDAPKSYWKSLDNYNCIETAKKIEKPVMVLQGEHDQQVPVTDYNLWKGAFGSKGNWTYKYYEGLGHTMIKTEPNTGYENYKTKGNVEQAVIEDIAQWIKSR